MDGILSKDDYEEPRCLLNMHPEVTPIPVGRIIDKLDSYLNKNDYDAAERHLKYWLICNDFCQEAKCPFRSHRQYFIFTEGIWKELWVSVPGIGHSDIRGLGTAGQWSAVSSTV